MEVQTNLEPAAVVSQSTNIAITGMGHDAQFKIGLCFILFCFPRQSLNI